MLDYPEALAQLLNAAAQQKTATVSLPISECYQHHLAQDINAKLDSPAFSNSAMDGYALNISETHRDEFKIIGRIAAGEARNSIHLHPGQAARIFTGAPIPQGCNTVIMQEYTQTEGNLLRCTTPPMLGEHIRIAGEEFARGKTLFTQGTHLTPAAVGVLASQGYSHAPVHAGVRITVFSSGNEVQNPDTVLRASAIYDANRYQLMAWLRALNCEVTDGGILPDSLEKTHAALQTAAKNTDLILTSGGASVGEEDHLKTALTESGNLKHWKLAIKPGKPFAWGHMQQTPVVMLPGNPVATFVTFKLLVEPILRRRMGASEVQARPHKISAHANFTIEQSGNRREFLRGVVRYDEHGVAQVDALPNQDSHMLATCARANALIDIAPNTSIAMQDIVPIILL